MNKFINLIFIIIFLVSTLPLKMSAQEITVWEADFIGDDNRMTLASEIATYAKQTANVKSGLKSNADLKLFITLKTTPDGGWIIGQYLILGNQNYNYLKYYSGWYIAISYHPDYYFSYLDQVKNDMADDLRTAAHNASQDRKEHIKK